MWKHDGKYHRLNQHSNSSITTFENCAQLSTNKHTMEFVDPLVNEVIVWLLREFPEAPPCLPCTLPILPDHSLLPTQSTISNCYRFTNISTFAKMLNKQLHIVPANCSVHPTCPVVFSHNRVSCWPTLVPLPPTIQYNTMESPVVSIFWIIRTSNTPQLWYQLVS